MSLPQATIDTLRSQFGPRLLLDEPLAKHTSARIGGPADGFIAAHTPDDLRGAARAAWGADVPLLILGGGSNVLIGDRGVRGLVVLNETKKLGITGRHITVESGYSAIQLARHCARRGLTGFEWAIGIPGTIGGAVYGNAGAHDGDVSQVVERITAITPGGEMHFSRDELAFEYRSSILKREQRKAVILEAVLIFAEGDPAAINAKMEEFSEYRKRTQPPGATIGSIFKNPPGEYAGRLIEAAGLKGTRSGSAGISTVHANWVVNLGEATAADVKALIDLARQKVKEQSGVELETEIELVGEW